MSAHSTAEHVRTNTLLSEFQTGIERRLGISFPSVTRHRVVAELGLEPEHITERGAVHGGVVMALADCASSRGARLNLPSGRATVTLEAKANFLVAGAGQTLRADARPLHLGPSVSVWRATMLRDEQPIADVTQTEMVVDDEAAHSMPARPVELGTAAGGSGRAGLAASNYSQAVIDERWRQILEGAAKVIAAKGFAKATIREIAAAAEMPVPTMYQYLEHKEDILYNLYKFFMTDIVAALERSRLGETAPTQRLVRAVRTMVDVFDKNHRFIKLMFQETRALTAEARRQVYALDAQYIAIFRELMTEAMQSGDLRIGNVELAANFVYFLCTIWPLRFWSIGKYGEAAVSDAIVDFVLHGLGADGTAPGPE